jgi:hypothetical protein
VVVVCVDHANDVWKELQRRQHGGASATDSTHVVDALDYEMGEPLEAEA